MAALQYADVPGYSALLLRRTFTELSLPGALLSRARAWLANREGPKWHDEEHTWTFPTGRGNPPATIAFGYIDSADDLDRYQSAEFQFIGFDELTEFDEYAYTFMFSRLRRVAGMPVPLRMRGASNPGGVGHDWVKRRFIIDGKAKGRIYIPATLDDNPALDREAYERSLSEMSDPVRAKQLRDGDWDVREAGKLIHVEKMIILSEPQATVNRHRAWDLAATEVERGSKEEKHKRANIDPDWTRGALGSLVNGFFVIEDMASVRGNPVAVENLIRETARKDGPDVPIYFEREPGSAGIALIDHYRRNVLPGYAVYDIPSSGDKKLRARPFSAAVDQGRVGVVEGAWNNEFFREASAFGTNKFHDDQVDAVTLCHRSLTEGMTGDEWARYYGKVVSGDFHKPTDIDRLPEMDYFSYLEKQEAKAREELELRKMRYRR